MLLRNIAADHAREPPGMMLSVGRVSYPGYIMQIPMSSQWRRYDGRRGLPAALFLRLLRPHVEPPRSALQWVSISAIARPTAYGGFPGGHLLPARLAHPEQMQGVLDTLAGHLHDLMTMRAGVDHDFTRHRQQVLCRPKAGAFGDEVRHAGANHQPHAAATQVGHFRQWRSIQANSRWKSLREVSNPASTLWQYS